MFDSIVVKTDVIIVVGSSVVVMLSSKAGTNIIVKLYQIFKYRIQLYLLQLLLNHH